MSVANSKSVYEGNRKPWEQFDTGGLFFKNAPGYSSKESAQQSEKSINPSGEMWVDCNIQTESHFQNQLFTEIIIN